MEQAVTEALNGVKGNVGGPFGCIIVKNNEIVGRGCNKVTSTNDPTSHAEMNAIRDACKNLSTFQLDDCIVYTSCEPCPMCLGAIYWARPSKVYYACTKEDAANAGFDDAFIYTEIHQRPLDRNIIFEQVAGTKAITVFEEWTNKEDKKVY